MRILIDTCLIKIYDKHFGKGNDEAINSVF